MWQPTTSTDYGPNIHLDYLIDFIERHRNQPFFAYYAQHLPHAPYDATPLSSDVGVRRNPAVFPEMVAYLDHQIGRILQKLNELYHDSLMENKRQSLYQQDLRLMN